MQVLKIIVEMLAFLSSIVLIVTVMFQTTKSEGLSGMIGGQSSSSLHTKVGIEKEIDRITRIAAICFLVTAFLAVLFMR